MKPPEKLFQKSDKKNRPRFLELFWFEEGFDYTTYVDRTGLNTYPFCDILLYEIKFGEEYIAL